MIFDEILSFFRALMVASALVKRLVVRPRFLVVASLMPAKDKTTLAAPPAIRPLPLAAGLIIIRALECLAST